MRFEESQLLTIAEAAALCGVTRRGFEYLMKRDDAPKPTLFKGKKLFVKESLTAWNQTRPRRKKARKP